MRYTTINWSLIRYNMITFKKLVKKVAFLLIIYLNLLSQIFKINVCNKV